MAKYIIDISDEAIEFMDGRSHINIFVEPECEVGDCKRYVLQIPKEDITPYTESDREAIENGVWEFVRCIMGMNANKYRECFGIDDIAEDDFTCKYTYQEAKKIYEEWKKEEEKIHTGDEVVYHGNKYAVVYVGADEVYHLIDETWIRKVVQGRYQLTKTGRRFIEIEKLIDKMLSRSISF